MPAEEAADKHMVNRKAQTSSRRGAAGTPAVWALVAIALVLTSCGSSTPAANPITVTIFPTSTSVNINITTRFTATALGGATNTVTWQVNGVKGGSTSTGTINTTGLYTAPSAVPSGGTVTVAAVSVDDTTVMATAALTILPPAQVTVLPTTVPLVPGATQTFAATVQQAPNSAVTWEVNGFPGGTPSLGVISSDGFYTAPGSPQPGGSVTVTAVSQADPPQSGSATVTLSFGTGSLKGPYSFTIHGKNASGAFFRAGRFSADGLGGLSGGLEDVHDANGVHPNIAFTGSYAVGTDGRGTLQINDGLAPSHFSIVMPNSRQAQIISFDSSGTAAGEADLQDNSFLTTSTLVGTYAFDFVGLDSQSNHISEVGEFFADGNGGIENGKMDINDNGSISAQVAFTGSYAIGASPNGHGTAQFLTTNGTLNFDVYMVSRGMVQFVEVDSTAATGSAIQREPNVSFGLSSLNGNYSFLISGSSAAGAIATAGSFSAGGNGILTGGVLDENNLGAVVHELFTGAYSLDSTGRGTATFTAANRTYTFVFYMTLQFNTVLQETDSSIVSDGVFAQQQGTPLSPSTLPGSYALQWSGATGAATLQFDGQVALNGSGNVTSGTIDTATFPGSPSAGETANGALSITTGGSGTFTLNPSTDNRQFAVYAVSPTQMFTVETGSGRVAAGSLIKQF